ncbi:MAG: histidine kinase [Chitinophagaceae bacterium]|nr:histidine kinase [Chitinophagaceae bacterium]
MRYINAGLFLLFNFLAVTIAAQKCDCPEYYILKAAYDASEEESDIYIRKLEISANKICIAKSYEWRGLDYMDLQNFDTAEIYFQKAEKIYKQSPCGDSIFLNIYKQWAQLYYIKGNFAKAQEFSFKLLKAAEASGNPHEIGVTYTMIAQLFNQTNQADKGINYARLAVPYLAKIDDPQKAADLFFKLSKRYLWHYQDTKTLSSLDTSELFSYQQLTLAKKINRKSSIAAAFSNLQGVAWEKKDFKKALAFLDSSFRYTDPDDISTLGTNYFDKADLYIELKNYKAAGIMADSALHYHQLSGHIAYIAETYELISRIARESGDYRKAYEYREMGSVITDSIRNVEKTKQVAELEKKYNQAKNEKTIKELAQQKKIYFLLAIAGLLSLIALAFFIRQQSLKNKQKILEAEQRLNRARMNPHFFFNALSSLQSFALQENDGKALAGNLSKFSHIMRETLESTYKEYVTIEQEKEFLDEYLGLQKLRFPQKFTYEIKSAESIEPDEILIPSMILQPFVENSIEHGFVGISYPGHIALSFAKKEKDLLISIIDNGKGLATTEKESTVHISRASQIIKDRIYLLNIKLKTKASFSIDNNTNEKGVTVLIKLPLLYKQNIKN